MKQLSLLVLALALTSRLGAQEAPASIADSLVSVSNRVSVFSGYELFLFRADGTYQEIVSQGISNSNLGVQTSAPASGTYAYATTPADGGTNEATTTGLAGTITFTSGSARAPIAVGTPFFGEGDPVVGVFPRNELTGAVNVSNNSWVSAGHPTIAGFVVQGNSPRWVLIRGAGPSLAQFGVASPVAAPVLTYSGLVDGSGIGEDNFTPHFDAATTTDTATVNIWDADPNLVTGFQTLFSLAGAFPFLPGSKDCAGLVLLQPGAYVIQSATPGDAGAVLTEIYVLPYGT